MVTFRFSVLISCLLAMFCSPSLALKKRPVGNWCLLKSCGLRHVACNNNGNYSPACLPGAKVIEMRRIIKLILTMFNNFRNKIAGGQVNYLVKAARMAKMVWSDELEFFAELNVKTCRFLRSSCMSSSHFTYIGTNTEIYSYGGPEKEHSNYEIIRMNIQSLFDQIKNVDNDTCLNLPYELRNQDVAKVTIAIGEKNTHIGCAALRYTYDFYHFFILTCAFATNNFIHRPLYTFGLTAGARCKRKDKQFPNLCHSSEKYARGENNRIRRLAYFMQNRLRSRIIHDGKNFHISM